MTAKWNQTLSSQQLDSRLETSWASTTPQSLALCSSGSPRDSSGEVPLLGPALGPPHQPSLFSDCGSLMGVYWVLAIALRCSAVVVAVQGRGHLCFCRMKQRKVWQVAIRKCARGDGSCSSTSTLLQEWILRCSSLDEYASACTHPCQIIKIEESKEEKKAEEEKEDYIFPSHLYTHVTILSRTLIIKGNSEVEVRKEGTREGEKWDGMDTRGGD